MIICADGLTGMKEAIGTAFPDTEYQRCIVHQVRNTLKYVPYKDMKAFAADLKTIYLAPSEEQGRAQLERVTEKWEAKYPNAMKSWAQNWDVISPIFKFSNDVRKVIYTTNAIESITEIPLSFNLAGNKEMDSAAKKLGQGLRRIYSHVRGAHPVLN